MNTIPAVNILDACEQGLRQTAGTALAAGDYDSARQIIAWAENVAAMSAIARSPIHPAAPGADAPSGADAPVGRNAGVAPASAPASLRTPKSRPPEDKYPLFLRRGDELVKVGWSKTDRKEYHHRAPKRALDALIATLKRIASGGNNFSSDDLNPLKDSPSGGVYPTYQVFVALAWLRKLGLVQQHGRKGGYTLVTERPIDTTVAAAWPQLPPWRG